MMIPLIITPCTRCRNNDPSEFVRITNGVECLVCGFKRYLSTLPPQARTEEEYEEYLSYDRSRHIRGDG